MTNTAGQPFFQPLTIPPEWCPSGSTWPEILNEFQDKFLKGGSIVIPGFGQVDLTQIAQLIQQVQQLQAQVAAITKVERSGFGAPVTLNGITTITFTAMPSSNYRVNVIPVDDGEVISAGDFAWSLVPGSKTVTQFQIRTHNMPADFTLDWWIRET